MIWSLIYDETKEKVYNKYHCFKSKNDISLCGKWFMNDFYEMTLEDNRCEFDETEQKGCLCKGCLKSFKKIERGIK